MKTTLIFTNQNLEISNFVYQHGQLNKFSFLSSSPLSKCSQEFPSAADAVLTSAFPWQLSYNHPCQQSASCSNLISTHSINRFHRQFFCASPLRSTKHQHHCRQVPIVLHCFTPRIMPHQPVSMQLVLVLQAARTPVLCPNSNCLFFFFSLSHTFLPVPQHLAEFHGKQFSHCNSRSFEWFWVHFDQEQLGLPKTIPP